MRQACNWSILAFPAPLWCHPRCHASVPCNDCWQELGIHISTGSMLRPELLQQVVFLVLVWCHVHLHLHHILHSIVNSSPYTLTGSKFSLPPPPWWSPSSFLIFFSCAFHFLHFKRCSRPNLNIWNIPYWKYNPCNVYNVQKLQMYCRVHNTPWLWFTDKPYLVISDNFEHQVMEQGKVLTSSKGLCNKSIRIVIKCSSLEYSTQN